MLFAAAVLLPLLTLSPRTGFTQEASAPTLLTLDEAISLALQHNRLIHSSALDVLKLDDQLASARTQRLPYFSWYTFASQRLTALDFRFERGVFGLYPGIGPIPATDTSIHVPLQLAAVLIGKIDQPLSQQYRIGLNLRYLDTGKQIALQQERLQKQTVIDQVKRTYFSILQMQSSLESVEESIRLYKELDRVTDQYLLQQVALKSQSLEIKTRLAKAEYDALTLRNPLQTQKEQLNSLLGRDILTEFSVNPVPEATGVETDIAAARKLSLQQRPELTQARLKIRQAEYDWRAKKAEYIPNVSLSFSYLSPINYGSLVPSNIAGVGLLFDWEPFDWGKKKHELAQKSRTIEQAQLALRDTEDQVAIDVGGKFRKLQETRQLIVIGRLAQETAREKMRVISNRYSRESSLLSDVLQAQASLAEATSQYQQALLNYWSARADFEKALGTDP
jgi:outer membrane protein TolC